MQTNTELDQAFSVTDQQKAFFREHGWIKLKQVLSPETIDYYRKAITDAVERLNTESRPLEQRDTYAKAFLQIMNIWTKDETVKQFSLSRRLAGIASELMGSDGVRLYHDQALYKEPGGGHTPWHADQYYWPVDTPNTCTVWAPLQATPLEMGPLAFADKSQQFEIGRDLAISDDSEKQLDAALKEHGFEQIVEPFDLGEVSYHYGWTFHRAGANQTDRPRQVMTVIYVDAAATLVQPQNENQKRDWETWCPGVEIGQAIASPLNPLLWQRD